MKTFSLLNPQVEQKDAASFASLSACILGSILIGLFAQVSIPLPFTPIPIATQSAVVLLLGVLLGRKAVFSVAGFLAQGLLGFPVFAGGMAGFALLAGPRGGYLAGYLAAAYVVGWIIERSSEKTLLRAFYAMAAGTLVIYLCGALRLASFIGLQKALLLGVAPFLIGDLCKIFVGLKLLKAFRWS